MVFTFVDDFTPFKINLTIKMKSSKSPTFGAKILGLRLTLTVWVENLVPTKHGTKRMASIYYQRTSMSNMLPTC